MFTLEYIQIYADSVANDDEKDKRSKKALELYSYLRNNREGLLPYQKRGIKIPEASEGIEYKNMGVQENQNCTVITLRVKHRRMRWSVNGANNMAKALYQKENGELIETIERYTDGLIFTMKMQEVIETLSAAKAPKKDEKGDPYAEDKQSYAPVGCGADGIKESIPGSLLWVRNRIGAGREKASELSEKSKSSQASKRKGKVPTIT